MLIFFSFCYFSLLICSSSNLFWPLSSLLLMFFYIYSSNFLFCSNLSFAFSYMNQDSISLFMVFLLFSIMFISFLGTFEFSSPFIMSQVYFFLSLFCYQVFSSSNLFYIYFFYEASLIPIFFIIIKWGSYPERSISALMMLIYTLIFGAPVLILIMILNNESGTWYLPLFLDTKFSILFSMFIFLCFSVKLPIYGLHFWLPMAHVEAPTFGSVILASILLKLGGVGLIRFSSFMNILSMKNSIMAYFMIFIIFSTLICCYQSDMKRLIAYSSVAHMMVIPFMIFANNSLAIQSIILVMFLHGLSSTLLFMSVGILYSMFSSRQLVLMRGLLVVSPLFSMFLILIFLFTLSAPPFPSYVAEVFFLYSSYILTPDFIYVVLLFAFLGLLYNLNWLSSVLFASSLDMVFTLTMIKMSQFLLILATFLILLPFSFMFFLL